MRHTSIISLLALLSLLSSCRNKPGVHSSVHPDWKKHELPNGWSFWAPPEFRSYEVQGVDSEPGFIISDKDSIHLQFDSGIELLPKARNCNFSSEILEAQKDVEDGWYKEFYNVPTMHTAYVDTIDNKVAIVVKPTTPKEGTVGISIKDCKTGAWLGITGDNLSPLNEALVLSVFKTITFDGVNKAVK